MGTSKTHVKHPEGHVLLRRWDQALPVIDRGEGIYLYDKEGKKYIDASGGALVTAIGHGHKEIADRMREQAMRVGYINGNHFATLESEELAAKLIKHAPKTLNKVFFLSSGSEAVEAAIKFARQYFFDAGLEKKYKIIARSPGYHGNTLYALSASGRPRYKKYFGPLLNDVHLIPTPYEYRSPVPYEDKGAEHYVKELEKAILEEGADTVAAFLLEPVSGTSTGGSCPPGDYLKRVQELCKKHNILTIADEVLCGIGRTGAFYASNHWGFEPDLMVLGKGLNAGYTALSALLVGDKHVEVLNKGSGHFMHAQTYVNTPAGVGTGLAVIDFIEKNKCVENSKTLGVYFHEQLHEKIMKRFDCVGNISGRGLFAGLELVKDRKTKDPYARSEKMAEKLQNLCAENGLIVWVNTGQVDGTLGDILVLGPPLIISKAQIDELIEKLQKAFSKLA